MSTQAEIARSDEKEFVSFSVSGQKYCLEITQIREIRRWSPVTVLPHAPADVLGVMNLRGSVIPIYDLAVRFNLGRAEAGERNVVIVTALDDVQVGLLVESVAEIISVPTSSIQETPDVKSDSTLDCIPGVISRDDEMIRIVNLSTVIKTSELA